MLSEKNKRPKNSRNNEVQGQIFGHNYPILFKREAKPSKLYSLIIVEVFLIASQDSFSYFS